VEAVDEVEEIVARVAALDIGKAEVVCCVRVPDRLTGGRAQEVRTFTTMTGQLIELAEWLRGLGVTRVVMESTSDYWKPPFYVLEAAGFEPWLVNAKDVKHLPGRAKTDRLDAVWLAKLAERQMLRPSFVPPVEIRELRDLTRYRVDLVETRNGYKQRAEKLLEDAQIKISVVASDIFGVSGRAIMSALIDGERDPDRLADLARGVLRKKTEALVEAMRGRFNDHHAFLLGTIVGQVDRIDADIAALDERIETMLVPFAQAVAVLDEIPGINRAAAAAIIAEIGIDMSRFPTPGHLCSWAGFAPISKDSANRSGPRRTGHGSRYLARTMGNAVAGAARGQSFYGERYRRLVRRRNRNTAIVAVARSMLVGIWHILDNPENGYIDLGSDWHDQRRRIDPATTHIRQLQKLGYRVTVERAA
jgi:transposase